MVGTHKWIYAHYTHPDVILNQFINVPIIDGWDAQMTLCSLHPPRRRVESVYQRCYNWWLERTNDSMLITPTQTSRWISLSTLLWLMVGTHKWIYAHYTHPDVILNQFINVPIIDGWDAQMTLCSLHPPIRRVESVYQRCYNWWLERTNDSMLITPNPDVKLNQVINVPIIDGWDAQMTLCSLHPPRLRVETVYQRSYNWWLERTNDSMLITPTQTSYWISLSTLL